MEPKLCYIKEDYFKERKHFEKMLDAGNTLKQARRTHLCVEIKIDSNRYYVPLRNNLGEELRKFGRIGHSIPSASREKAGLDYRYALIVNDEKYLEIQKEKKIPNSQFKKIKNDYEQIKTEFEAYVTGFVKAAKKKRNDKEPLYKESSLVNFISDIVK